MTATRSGSSQSDEEDEESTAPPVLFVEQYAHRVLDYSAQYGSDASFSYTASNCLGVPTKFPAYGDSPQAFVLLNYGSFWQKSPAGRMWATSPTCARPSECRCHNYQHFIDLLFQHSVHAIAIYVYETYNPGSLREIWGGDCRGTWSRLWGYRTEDPQPGHQPRAFSPPLLTSPAPIQMIRLIFDPGSLGNHPEVDAVALLGSVSQDDICIPSQGSQIWEQTPVLKWILDNNITAASTQSSEWPNLLSLDLSSEASPVNLTQATASVAAPSESDSRIVESSFESLPKEILVLIFRHLGLGSLGQCARVCQLFRDIVRDPKLYHKLCLKPWFHSVSDSTLQTLSPRLGLTSAVDLSWCGNYGLVSTQGLETFFTHLGPSLRHLQLANCHSAAQSVLNQISISCPSLSQLNLSNCHLLKPGDFAPMAVLTRLQCLNLHSTRISQKELGPILKANPRLQVLNISACRWVNGDQITECLVTCCPQLVSLEMWRNPSLSARGVDSLCQLAQLRELDLGWCTTVDATTGVLVRLAQKCSHLEKLFLTAHRQTTDSDILALASNLPLLCQLDIMGTKNVGVAAINHILSKCRRLTLLDISYCELLEDPIVLNALRQEFPQCHVVSTSTL